MPDNVRYFYWRDGDNHPRVTLCRLVEEGIVKYGWALCSFLDNPCKRQGRAIALGRARAATQSVEGETPQPAQRFARPINRAAAEDIIWQCRAESLFALCVFNSTFQLPQPMRPELGTAS